MQTPSSRPGLALKRRPLCPGVPLNSGKAQGYGEGRENNPDSSAGKTWPQAGMSVPVFQDLSLALEQRQAAGAGEQPGPAALAAQTCAGPPLLWFSPVSPVAAVLLLSWYLEGKEVTRQRQACSVPEGFQQFLIVVTLKSWRMTLLAGKSAGDCRQLGLAPL